MSNFLKTLPEISDLEKQFPGSTGLSWFCRNKNEDTLVPNAFTSFVTHQPQTNGMKHSLDYLQSLLTLKLL